MTIKDDLRKHFEKFGKIENIQIFRDYFDANCRPKFAFLTYEDEAGATIALDTRIHKIKDEKGHNKRVSVRKYNINHGKSTTWA